MSVEQELVFLRREIDRRLAEIEKRLDLLTFPDTSQDHVRRRPLRAGEGLKAGQVLTLLGRDGNIHQFTDGHGFVAGHELFAYWTGAQAAHNVAVAMRDIEQGEYILARRGDIEWV